MTEILEMTIRRRDGLVTELTAGGCAARPRAIDRHAPTRPLSLRTGHVSICAPLEHPSFDRPQRTHSRAEDLLHVP